MHICVSIRAHAYTIYPHSSIFTIACMCAMNPSAHVDACTCIRHGTLSTPCALPQSRMMCDGVFKYHVFSKWNHIAFSKPDGSNLQALDAFLSIRDNHHMVIKCQYPGCSRMDQIMPICTMCAKTFCIGCVSHRMHVLERLSPLSIRCICHSCKRESMFFARGRLRAVLDDEDEFEEIKRIQSSKMNVPCRRCGKTVEQTGSRGVSCMCFECPHYCSDSCREADWELRHKRVCSSRQASAQHKLLQSFQAKIRGFSHPMRVIITFLRQDGRGIRWF